MSQEATSSTIRSFAQSHDLTHPKYRPDIDGLRAVAVLSVVGFHAFPESLKGGFIGVDIFFVISGYLISTIILENLDRNSFSFIEFYSRRIRRIFPALLVTLITSLSFGWFALFPDEYKQLGKHIASGAGFASNFVLWDESGYFDNTAQSKPLLHLWSLGIEEQFYIIWPLLLWIAWRQKLYLAAALGIAGLGSFLLNIKETGIDTVAVFYSPQTRFWELLIGSTLAHVTLRRREELTKLADRYGYLQSLTGVALVSIGLLLISQERAFPGWWAALPTIGSALIISAGAQTWFNNTILSSRILVWFGLISYPLYLWHWPLLSFARIIASEPPPREMRIAAIALSILLAWLTYRLIERPIRFGKSGRATTIALLLSMSLVGLTGYLCYERNGIESRQAVNTYVLNKNVTDQFVGPLWQYTTNSSCLERFPFEESAHYRWWFCVASKDQSPTLIILGNSLANQLYPGLAHNNLLNHHSILSIGTCDPAKLFEPELRDENPCSGHRALHQQRFIDEIITNTGSVKFAVLDGLDRNPTIEYISALKQRIDFLEGKKIKVIIFTPNIQPDYDIRGCFLRPFNPRKRTCELDIKIRSELTQSFKPLVAHLSRSNPNVAFFDQNDVFCNERKCSMVLNGMPLFRDEFHHVSEYGSNEIARLFAAWTHINVPEMLK